MLAIVVLNYRTPSLVCDCLDSFAPQIVTGRDCVVVVDNCSADSSPQIITDHIEKKAYSWAKLVTAPSNDGFSAGNNFGMRSVPEADAYFLVNSDTLARPGALDALHEALEKYPKAGMISPRLEWPDETPQISCFRVLSPFSEVIEAAQTGPITKLLQRFDVPVPVRDTPMEPQWTSFAAVVVRRSTIERVGWMDEGYFMYFEDVDFCRRVQSANLDIIHYPKARIVHLRGGSSDVKAATKARKRRPKYYYEARSRYFAKFYGGRIGLIEANVGWSFGRILSTVRELIGNKEPHTCEMEGRDIWTNWRNPLKT